MIPHIAKWSFRGCVLLVALLGALLAFFVWQSHRRETRMAADAAPVTGHFASAGDTEIFFQEVGPASGRAILLIHGAGAWSEIWRETMTALAGSGFHVVAVDFPPFGFSGKPRGASEYSPPKQAKRIAGLLDALHLDHATVVAHSVGARPAIEFGLESTKRTDAMVLVDPALGFPSNAATIPHLERNHPSWILRGTFAIEPLRDALLAATGTNPLFIAPLFRSFVSRRDSVNPARVAMIRRPLAVRGTTRAYGDWLQYLLISQDDSPVSDLANLRGLSMPTLIIWGGADRVTPLWQGRRLAEMIPRSSLAVIDYAGHIPYIEDPQAFNHALLRFLTAQSLPLPSQGESRPKLPRPRASPTVGSPFGQPLGQLRLLSNRSVADGERFVCRKSTLDE